MASKDYPQQNNNLIGLLRHLGTILAISPPCYYFKHEQSKLRTFYRSYAILIFLVILIGSGLAVLGKATDVYPILPSTLIVTDMAVLLSITACNVTAILSPSIWFLEDFKTFLEIFNKTSNCLAKCNSVKVKTCKTFYVELAVGHLILFALLVTDAYIWITAMTFTQYRHYIFRGFQCYHFFITIMTMYHFVLSIKYRFELINSGLKNLNNVPLPSNYTTTQEVKMEKYEGHYTVRQLAEQYKIQIQQIALFNKIFGWQILFVALAIMVGLLNSLDILTLVNESDGGSEVVFQYGLTILSTLWAIWQLLLGAVLTIPCSSTMKEAQRTSDLCFSILVRLPVIPSNAMEKALKNELYLLKDLAINRCPTFSAAGFFPVDYPSFLAIFASVTSYVIVLIQFHK